MSGGVGNVGGVSKWDEATIRSLVQTQFLLNEQKLIENKAANIAAK